MFCPHRCPSQESFLHCFLPRLQLCIIFVSAARTYQGTLNLHIFSNVCYSIETCLSSPSHFSFLHFSPFFFVHPSVLSSWLLRVRTRWSLCWWFPATSTVWSTLFNRTTSPKRTWLCCKPSCPGKDVTEWANQQTSCRYKIWWLTSHLQGCSTCIDVFALGAYSKGGRHTLVVAHFVMEFIF